MENINGKSKAKIKVLGIVAEYNPWHKGHKYQLAESMKLCGAEYSVGIMNGDFTQRGEPAMLDKWTRARMALEGGLDLVLELPFYFGCNSAEFFARGAVDLAIGTGVITHLGFGSESGDLESIKNVAKFLADEPLLFQQALGEKLKTGVNFPRARMEVLKDFLASKEIDLLASPNNILAIEYVKQLYKRGSSIEPVTIKRAGDGYNDEEYCQIASATAIRKALRELDGLEDKNTAWEKIQDMIPRETYEIIKENVGNLVFKDNQKFYDLLRFQLLQGKDLSQIFSAGEGIENAFLKNVRQCKTLEELLSKVKSKRYTYAGLSRLAAHMVMNFTKEQPEPKYIRVLGFTEGGRNVLKMIKNNIAEDYELVTNINKTTADLSVDIKASDLYNLISQGDLYKKSDFVTRPVNVLNK